MNMQHWAGHLRHPLQWQRLQEECTHLWTVRRMHTLMNCEKNAHTYELWEECTHLWTVRRMHTLINCEKNAHTYQLWEECTHLWTVRRMHTLMNCEKYEHTYELRMYPLVCLSVLFNFFLLLKLALAFNIPYIFLFWVCVVGVAVQYFEPYLHWRAQELIAAQCYFSSSFDLYIYMYISAAVHNFSWF